MPIDRLTTKTSNESYRYYFTDPEDYRRAMRRAAYLESVGCPARAWRVRLNLDGVPVTYPPLGVGDEREVKLPEPRREPNKRIYKKRNRKLEYAQRKLREAAREKPLLTADAAEAKFQAAHDRAEKQLANNRRIFYGRG